MANIPYVSLEPVVSIIGGPRRRFRPPISHHNGRHHLVIDTASEVPLWQSMCSSPTLKAMNYSSNLITNQQSKPKLVSCKSGVFHELASKERG